ncbi:activating signal cointegrator 1 complex subunit 3, helc1, putative [Entamoeba invadens IP1]|uniref:Activating signal cointegrator 1 complex subunit 3, helc1, putative n=1 Tax=Entamoeba invadens IP1 TaxID=370355 RepID=A0A0A1UE46_ENTIV|nr:activating signal cointegrator 1 complex subunit 3, helc1, putative [Entamoeba invadens IP1]ELP91075.1 activating signal cointegrator 1 complex subunit 3, helc1, putative [Entamoeba invadens IP1]|eukprot:XP_004257846.1 activating signal cointegrator 1 complex subunit 3, helc1, putative [Entamoeba invadens IP1]
MLRESLPYGIGMHHAGLNEKDRDLVEDLFKSNKIQILITTATLAWGVNLPAHLVIIKGTEYFDGKKHQFVDMPLTDILQMMGRAGRPQFDNEGVAVILTYEPKKDFLKKFLFEPFPLESYFENVIADQLNAEIAVGNVTCLKDAVKFLTYTYYFRRLLKNPNYYGYDGKIQIGKFLVSKVLTAIEQLVSAKCITYEDGELQATSIGKVGTMYYISYLTIKMFAVRMRKNLSHQEIIQIIADAAEYNNHPVRHEDDNHCRTLSKSVRYGSVKGSFDDPHTKVFLLLSAYFGDNTLPIVDFVLDTKSVLDQAIRIVQAFIDIVAEKGYTDVVVRAIEVLQMIGSGRWVFESPLLTLAGVSQKNVVKFERQNLRYLPQFFGMEQSALTKACKTAGLNSKQTDQIRTQIAKLPRVDVKLIVPEKVEICDEIFDISINLVRQNQGSNYAFLPRFPKMKQEGWYVIVLRPDGSLAALKKVGIKKATNVTLMCVCPVITGTFNFKVLLLSDCYLGLDQQYELPVTFV